MSYKDKLDNCLVSLDVGNKNALFILLGRDGTICRRGNGNPDKEFELLKGYSDLEHYQAFMMTVSEELFQFSGLFEQKPIQGRPCQMMIVFSGANGEEAGFKVNYGEDSQGPPREIAEMLINAVKLTDPWYEQERSKLSPHVYESPRMLDLLKDKKDSPKSWWKLW